MALTKVSRGLLSTSIVDNGNATAITIDSSENVGIGAGSPAAKAHIYDATTDAVLYIDSANVNGSHARFLASGSVKHFVGSGGGFGLGDVDDFAIRSFDNLIFATNNSSTERMRISSTGNVGIGVVPSAFLLPNGSTGALQLQSGGLLSAYNTSTYLSQNWYYNAGEKYIANGSASRYAQTGAEHVWSSAGNNTSGAGAGLSWQDRMRIDSSGNVGIGTSSPDTLLHVNGQAKFENNVTLNETTPALIAPSGDLRIFTGGSESMRIDSSGFLLVGRTSASFGSDTGLVLRPNNDSYIIANHSPSLTMRRNSSDGAIAQFYRDGTNVGNIGTAGGDLTVGTGNAALRFNDGAPAIYTVNASTAAVVDASIDLGAPTARFKDLYLSGIANIGSWLRFGGGSNYYVHSDNANYLRFGTAGSERMRIDSSGNLLVGTTSAGTQAAGGVAIVPASDSLIRVGHANGTGSGSKYMQFSYNQSEVGSITQHGTSQVLFNVSSDQRLKENIADADDAGSKVDAIQVRKYDWKADGSHQDYGMIAQELLEVAPEAVSQGETEEDMMGVDYSKLVPMLIKEIQSLRNRVAQLEG